MGTWIITNGNGDQLAGPFTSEEAAEARAEEMHAASTSDDFSAFVAFVSSATGTWIDSQPAEKIEAALQRMREHPERFERTSAYAGGDERFGLWLALVNKRLSNAVGLGLFDLGDWNIRDAYDDGMSPREAAAETLRNDDTYSVLIGGE